METLLPPAATLFLAGLAGSLVFAFVRPEPSWLKGLSNIGVGTLVSMWTTPALCEWRGWASIHQQHLAAFSIGLLGVIGCKTFIALAETEATKAAAEGLVRGIKRALGIADK